MSRRLNLAVAASLVLHAAVLVLLPMLDARPPPKPQVMTARLVEQPRPVQEPAPAAAPPPQAKPEPKPVAKPVHKPVQKQAPITRSPPVIAAPQPVPQATPAPVPTPQSAPSVEPQPAPAPPQPPSPPSQAAAASPPASAQPSSAASDATTLAQYRVQIIELAGRYKRYPRIAQDNNWTGTADVRLMVGADGAIAALSVRKASGHAVLDNEALNMIRTAFGKAPLPDSLRGKAFSIDVPVVFSLKDG
jgi:periplasmic protein TonB